MKVGDQIYLLSEDRDSQHVPWSDLWSGFGTIGWYAFGGPAAHIGIFQKEFVERKKWVSDKLFAELLGLGHCLPGPTSTQMSFALGITQRGVWGGLLTGMLFMYPGLLLQSLAGYGMGKALENPDPWLRAVLGGLTAAAVGLVAEAGIVLSKKQCPDRLTQAIAILSGVITYLLPYQWIFPASIIVGALITLVLTRPKEQTVSGDILEIEEEMSHFGLSVWGGAFLCFLWFAILVGLMIVRPMLNYDDWKPLFWFESFYRIGSLIFGGGQVVLPMILAEVTQFKQQCTDVPDALGHLIQHCTAIEQPVFPHGTSWVTSEQILTGLAIAQGLPGPLFNISAYLGAQLGGVVGVAACWLGLFLPGVMLMFGVLPLWGKFRNFSIYRRMLPGLNAAAVGLIYGACFELVVKTLSGSMFPDVSMCIGFVCFCLTYLFEFSAPLTVVSGAVFGVGAWYAGLK
eukprot:GDKI01027769.1.p1 GENE.GDKI01027769.1~~GDKI01027769.1.p1  ORF type:complete len:466 (-),score=96.26 GDKI01027769.1:17-1387(-)